MSEQTLATVIAAPLQFLNWGWWVIHIIGVVVVLLIGYALGKKCAAAGSDRPAGA